MKQEEILRKINTIINELEEQYRFIDETKSHINDLELELFAANAHFLTDHIEILRKLNQQLVNVPLQIAPPQPVMAQPAAEQQGTTQKSAPQPRLEKPGIPPVTSEKFFEPVVHPVKPEAKEEPKRVIDLDITPNHLPYELEESYKPTENRARDYFEPTPEPVAPPIVRHTLILDEAAAIDEYEDDEIAFDDLDDDSTPAESTAVIPEVEKPVWLPPPPVVVPPAPVAAPAPPVVVPPAPVAAPAPPVVVPPAPVAAPAPPVVAPLPPVYTAPPPQPQPVYEPKPEPVVAATPQPDGPVIPFATDKAPEDQTILTINQRISAQLAASARPAVQPELLPVKDLKGAITLNDKLLFVKDLFNGYSMSYSEAVEILNRFNKFEEADQFLKLNYVAKNNWAGKQAAADKFYALLKRRFPV